MVWLCVTMETKGLGFGAEPEALQSFQTMKRYSTDYRPQVACYLVPVPERATDC